MYVSLLQTARWAQLFPLAACLTLIVLSVGWPRNVDYLLLLAVGQWTLATLSMQAVLVQRAIENASVLNIEHRLSRGMIAFFWYPPIALVTAVLLAGFAETKWLVLVLLLPFYAVFLGVPFALHQLYRSSLADAHGEPYERQRTGGLAFVLCAALFGAALYKHQAPIVFTSLGFKHDAAGELWLVRFSYLLGCVAFLAQRKMVADIAQAQAISATRRGIIDMNAVRNLFRAPAPLSGPVMWGALLLAVMPLALAMIAINIGDLLRVWKGWTAAG